MKKEGREIGELRTQSVLSTYCVNRRRLVLQWGDRRKWVFAEDEIEGELVASRL